MPQSGEAEEIADFSFVSSYRADYFRNSAGRRKRNYGSVRRRDSLVSWPTAHRVVASNRDNGAVRREKTGRYFPFFAWLRWHQISKKWEIPPIIQDNRKTIPAQTRLESYRGGQIVSLTTLDVRNICAWVAIFGRVDRLYSRAERPVWPAGFRVKHNNHFQTSSSV